MTESSFTDFVRHGLAALAREAPAHHRRVVDALAGREVSLRVEGELLALCFAVDPADPHADPVRAAARRPAVELETSKRAVLDLALGRIGLVDAILGDHVRVRGAVSDLLACHDALMAYLHGAVRSPSTPHQLDRFEGFCARDHEHEDEQHAC